MNRCLLVLLALVSSVGLLPAQGAGTAEERRTKVEESAKKMREGLVTPKTIRSHVRVQVRLKNGNRLRGVVKDGKLVERVNGLRFVIASAKDRGAGIRLWYTGGSHNYVFVPFSSLAGYKILERLSTKELGAIEKRMRMEESRKAEERRHRVEAAKRAAELAKTAKGKGKAGPGAPGIGGAKPGIVGANPAPGGEAKPGEGEELTPQQKEQAALLSDYPPSGGWNASKRDEIKNRMAVLGVQPSAFELRFVDVYGKWLAACQAEGIDPNAVAKPEPTKRGSRRGSKRGKK